MLLRQACATAAALVLLTACADDPPPAVSLPPVSPAASPEASPVPSAAPVPAAAQAETPEGAAEFARFFYAEVERAYVERDPEVVARLSAPGCQACAKFTKTLVGVRAKDERYEGVEYDIRFAEAPVSSGGRTAVTVIYDGPPVVHYASDGSVIGKEPEATGLEEELVLVRDGRSWLVQEVRRP